MQLLFFDIQFVIGQYWPQVLKACEITPLAKLPVS